MLFLVITIAVRIWFQFYVICLHIYVWFAYLGADHESSSIIIVLFVTHQIQKEKQTLLQPTDDTHFPFFVLANWCSVINTGARQHVLMLQNFSPTGEKHSQRKTGSHLKWHAWALYYFPCQCRFANRCTFIAILNIRFDLIDSTGKSNIYRKRRNHFGSEWAITARF